MPYPEICPECGGAFRNTGTHYTARRNEVGRHVLLELGCQNTTRRYWWDFTTGVAADNGETPGRRDATNGSVVHETNGHAGIATLDPPQVLSMDDIVTQTPTLTIEPSLAEAVTAALEPTVLEPPSPPPNVPPSLKDAFVRQLQLDRLTLRQMRSWLMADDARRAIEVAAGATEATYERLALILFGVDLPQLLGKQPAPPANPGMSAEERLELQREKARIRARLRRAAAKAARLAQ
jgi:hypothetical protein